MATVRSAQQSVLLRAATGAAVKLHRSQRAMMTYGALRPKTADYQDGGPWSSMVKSRRKPTIRRSRH